MSAYTILGKYNNGNTSELDADYGDVKKVVWREMAYADTIIIIDNVLKNMETLNSIDFGVFESDRMPGTLHYSPVGITIKTEEGEKLVYTHKHSLVEHEYEVITLFTDSNSIASQTHYTSKAHLYETMYQSMSLTNSERIEITNLGTGEKSMMRHIRTDPETAITEWAGLDKNKKLTYMEINERGLLFRGKYVVMV